MDLLVSNINDRGHQSAAYRIERDSLGDVFVPVERYFGAQTARAVSNFTISGRSISELPHLIRALAYVKIAAALANTGAEGLSQKKRDAIIAACQQVIEGRLDNEFVVDVLQGGAGTSTNMNMNEVVANRANELLGGAKGEYTLVHPIDDVNRCQSTNDAYATAVRLSIYAMNQELMAALETLADAFGSKASQFSDIAKLGRTQLQDAVPMTLGQEFSAYATTTREDVARLKEIQRFFLEINLGGTAIGTGIAASDVYRRSVVQHLREVTGLNVLSAENLIEATWDMGAFVLYSGMLKRVASKLSKIANDLRLLSSGPRGGLGELILPQRQPGSSLMPGKVNPVAAEALNQVCFMVYGLDLTVGMAAEAGQLQLNAMEPVIVFSLHQAGKLLTQCISNFVETCVVGIEANIDRCRENLETSMALATALVPYVGYDKATELAKEALRSGRALRQVATDFDPILGSCLDRHRL